MRPAFVYVQSVSRKCARPWPPLPIRLGKVSEKKAEKLKTKVEALVIAAIMGDDPDP